jgi:hypothetical protein
MSIEDQIRDTLSAAVRGLEQPDRWAEVVAEGRRRRRNRRVAAAGSITVVLGVVIAVAVTLAGGSTTKQVRIGPTRGGQQSPVTGVTAPTTSSPPRTTPSTLAPAVSPSTAAPTPTTTVARPPGGQAPVASPSTPVPYGFGYMPLFPFASQAQAATWLAAFRSSGIQPWHEDPGATALAFTGFLGYANVNQVIGTTVTGHEARVSVGFLISPSQPRAAAVIHLVRFGPEPNAPWEVVGTDDQPSLTLTTPAYGSSVTSPISAGGQITGVDESITVEVLAVSSNSLLGRTCCQPAGGTGNPWRVTVPFTAGPAQTLVVSASTGGHVAAVERFAVTGVRN